MSERITWTLVDGENIDATLGGSILGRRPQPDERPRWDRLLTFLEERWHQDVRGLFFLNATTHLPMPFVQALLALGYTPVPLSGPAEAKVVDLAIQRTLQALQGRDADVVLVSHVTPIKSILRHAFCASGALYRTLHLDLAGLSVIEIFPDGSEGSGGEVGVNNKGSNKDSAVVRRVNDTHFLDGETVR